MPIEILMPVLSPTMTEGKIAKWHKQEGDFVEEGDVLADIETDKVTTELEAEDSGVLEKILIEAGDELIAIHTPIAMLLSEEDDNEKSDDDETEEKSDDDESLDDMEEETEEKLDDIENDSDEYSEEEKTDDVEEKETSKKNKKSSKKSKKGNKNTSSSQVVLPSGRNSSPDYVEVPHSPVRKALSEKAAETNIVVPQVSFTVDCNLEALYKLRDDMNSKAEMLGHDVKLSVNDFIIRAVALALKKVPAVNVSWTEDYMKMYSDIDISVAITTPSGLQRPVLRNVDRRKLMEISRAMKNLSIKARNGKITEEETQGGTFTISNLSMFNVKHFTSIVNPPQACTLSIGEEEQRLVVTEGAIAVAFVMTCVLSVDARAVEGPMAARFLSTFKKIIEEPLMMVL